MVVTFAVAETGTDGIIEGDDSKSQSHLAKQDLTTLDVTRLTALTPEVVGTQRIYRHC